MFWRRRIETRASRACMVGQLGLEQLDVRVVPATTIPAPGTALVGGAFTAVALNEKGNAIATLADGSHQILLKTTLNGTLAYKLPNVVQPGDVLVVSPDGEASDVLHFTDVVGPGGLTGYVEVFSAADADATPADVGVPDPFALSANAVQVTEEGLPELFAFANYTSDNATYNFISDSP